MYANLPHLLEALNDTGMLKEAVPGRQLGLPGAEAGGPIFRGAGQTVGPAFSPEPIPGAGVQPGKLLGKGSLVQRLGSRASQGAKDLWSGGSQYMSRGGKLLGGTHKLRNRAGLLGGAALLAAGIPTYLASRKQQQQDALSSQTPDILQNNPAFGGGMQEPQYGGEYGGGYEQPTEQYGGSDQYSEQDFQRMLAQMYPEFGKQSNYSPSAAGVAAPPSAPRVTAPGPGVAGIPTIKPGEPPKLPKGLHSPSGGAFGAPKAPKAPSVPKIAESNAIYPLLAAAAGGVGGHMAGEKLVQPYLKGQELAQQLKIQKAQAAAKTLKGAGKAAPATIAAAGALLLAALTALAIKRKQASQSVDRQGSRPISQQLLREKAQAYNDSIGAGFAPQDRQEFGRY